MKFTALFGVATFVALVLGAILVPVVDGAGVYVTIFLVLYAFSMAKMVRYYRSRDFWKMVAWCAVHALSGIIAVLVITFIFDIALRFAHS